MSQEAKPACGATTTSHNEVCARPLGHHGRHESADGSTTWELLWTVHLRTNLERAADMFRDIADDLESGEVSTSEIVRRLRDEAAHADLGVEASR